MKNLTSLILINLLFSCSTLNYLKYSKEDEFRHNKAFEEQVVIKEIESPKTQDKPLEVKAIQAVEVPKKNEETTKLIKKNKSSKVIENRKEIVKKNEKKIQRRQPEVEDDEGFEAHRTPINNPYRIGEKIVHSVSYFSAQAATMTFEVKPFVEVNKKKAYNFTIGMKTSSLFSKFYSVDNTVESYLDYETLLPLVHKYNARESGKLVQSHSFFDNEKLKAQFWEKKYTEKNGEESRELSWDILPYSQNAFSGIFYMRVFKWRLGKEYAFRVADDEKNFLFKGTAVSKEKLSTDAGEFDAVKIKVSVVSRGALTQSGNMFVWLSDDDRKIILRLEAEIKIGKLVSEITSYTSGQ